MSFAHFLDLCILKQFDFLYPIPQDEEEEEFEEIDPSAIIGGRRTRGVKVDYTSKEALAKAGLQGNEKDEDSDEDVEMK